MEDSINEHHRASLQTHHAITPSSTMTMCMAVVVIVPVRTPKAEAKAHDRGRVVDGRTVHHNGWRRRDVDRRRRVIHRSRNHVLHRGSLHHNRRGSHVHGRPDADRKAHLRGRRRAQRDQQNHSTEELVYNFTSFLALLPKPSALSHEGALVMPSDAVKRPRWIALRHR
jgi:hypothetical protein